MHGVCVRGCKGYDMCVLHVRTLVGTYVRCTRAVVAGGSIHD